MDLGCACKRHREGASPDDDDRRQMLDVFWTAWPPGFGGGKLLNESSLIFSLISVFQPIDIYTIPQSQPLMQTLYREKGARGSFTVPTLMLMGFRQGEAGCWTAPPSADPAHHSVLLSGAQADGFASAVLTMLTEVDTA